MAFCPVGAIIKREDGIVFIDSASCIGCDACIAACPFGVPYISGVSGIARKCDFCKDLLDKGEQPLCVTSCPMRALNYGEIDELRAAHGSVSSVDPLPSEPGTDPSLVITPSRFNPEGKIPGVLLSSPVEIDSVTVM